jgi:hypothetical protein
MKAGRLLFSKEPRLDGTTNLRKGTMTTGAGSGEDYEKPATSPVLSGRMGLLAGRLQVVAGSGQLEIELCS